MEVGVLGGLKYISSIALTSPPSRSAFSETALRAGRQHSQDGCSAPPEGWIKVTDADSARALEKQVREYLDLHGLSDSEALGPIILAIRKFLVQ